jgi:hypothetical protein
MGVDAISAISIVGPLRAGNNDMSAWWRRSIGLVHQCGSVAPSYPPAVHRGGRAGQSPRFQPQRFQTPRFTAAAVQPLPGSAAGTARRRVDRAHLPAEPGQDEVPTDELGRGHHVRVSDAPGDGAVGLDRERFQLGLDEDVGQA